jgi:hypothetical protein
VPDIRIHADERGPMFDGRARRAAAEYVDRLNYRLATEAEDMVRARLRRVLKNPTGYYESRISVQRAGSGYEVNDGNVIYGPWLEGTGSRNYPETRFKGYGTFRHVKRQIEQRSPGIAERLLRRYTSRM